MHLFQIILAVVLLFFTGDRFRKVGEAKLRSIVIMSADREWKKWHLTPDGWIAGAWGSYGNTFSEGSLPSTRLLTCKYQEYQGSVFSKVDKTISEEWRCDDEDAIDSALAKFGTCPQRI